MRRQKRTGRGLGIDSSGEPVVDPTENVLALVDAQSLHAAELREADAKYLASELRRIDELAAGEARRIEHLRKLDALHSSIIETMRNDKIDTTARLLASQAQELKNDFQVEIRSLNQFRWESGGKTLGQAMIFYIIVQVILSIAGVAAIILFFKPH